MKTVILAVLVVFGLTGCGGGLKELTPSQKQGNSKIKVFIDESASHARAEVFVDEYVKILNEGFKVSFRKIPDRCSIKKNKNGAYFQKYDRGVAVYDDGNYLECTVDSSKQPIVNELMKFKAKKLSVNRVEVEVDGLRDIKLKQVAIQQLPYDKELFAKLASIGYSNYNIDEHAMKDEGRLILRLYPKHSMIKDLYTQELSKRGFEIVDNYKDADRAIYIENIAALPSRFGGGIKEFYRKNRDEVIKQDITGIESYGGDNIGNFRFKRTETFTAANAASRYLGGSVSFAKFGLGMMALDGLLGQKKVPETFIAYKLIFENKKFNKDSSNDVEKYRFRGGVYSISLRTWSSVKKMRESIYGINLKSIDDKEVKEDLINYFENDETNRKNELMKADYDFINSL